jgi:3-polyprenyl-4-hydroxybenzoate decarboxylase
MDCQSMKRRLIISLSGTLGVIYGIRTFMYLRTTDDVETQLAMSEAAVLSAISTSSLCQVWLRCLSGSTR